MNARFLQLHFLTSYPAALLNRDDAGFAKRLPFGGATRTRISSQCLKRHWRTAQGEVSFADLGEMSVRSRLTFEKFIVQPLVAEGIDEKLAREVTGALMDEVLGSSAKAKKAKAAKGDDPEASAALETGQIVVLGRPELNFLRQEALAVCAERPDLKKVAGLVKDRLGKEGKKNLQELKLAAGLDAALFGRMVTSDSLARGDAAIHVAHAFTVHSEQSESDYFSAVDDLLSSGDDQQLGSGHIGNVELTSGLYYGYIVVDLPLLVSNLEGVDRKKWLDADRTLASRVVDHLIQIASTVSPGAKLGSTAPYSYAQLVMLEAGNAQPRSLANAFMKPVQERPDLLGNAYGSLASHVQELDRMYGGDLRRRAAAMGPVERLADAFPVDGGVKDLASWAAGLVRGE